MESIGWAMGAGLVGAGVEIGYEPVAGVQRLCVQSVIGAVLVRIQLNGEPHETEAATVSALVETLGLDIRKVAVERNLEIVPKSLHATTAIQDGDRIELVQFVGGG